MTSRRSSSSADLRATLPHGRHPASTRSRTVPGGPWRPRPWSGVLEADPICQRRAHGPCTPLEDLLRETRDRVEGHQRQQARRTQPRRRKGLRASPVPRARGHSSPSTSGFGAGAPPDLVRSSNGGETQPCCHGHSGNDSGVCQRRVCAAPRSTRARANAPRHKPCARLASRRGGRA